MRTLLRPASILAVVLATAALPFSASAYPLDGYESTGITRLLRQRWIQEGEMAGKKRPGSGELLPLSMVDLRLLDQPDLDLPPADPKITSELKSHSSSLPPTHHGLPQPPQ